MPVEHRGCPPFETFGVEKSESNPKNRSFSKDDIIANRSVSVERLDDGSLCRNPTETEPDRLCDRPWKESQEHDGANEGANDHPNDELPLTVQSDSADRRRNEPWRSIVQKLVHVVFDCHVS